MQNEYKLRAGTLLHDPINKDFNMILTPARLTEPLALYHLAYNPKAIQYFEVFPDDLADRISKFLADESNGLASKVLKSTENRINILTETLKKAKIAQDNATKALTEANKAVADIEEQLKAARAIAGGDSPAFDPPRPKEDEEVKKDPTGVQSGTMVVSPKGQGPAKDLDREDENPSENNLASEDEIPLEDVLDSEDKTSPVFDLASEVQLLIDAGLVEAEVLDALSDNIKGGQTSKKEVSKTFKGLSA